MENEHAKRKRSSNWVEEDKLLLKELVKERVSDIENKNTDTNTNKKKKNAWMDLEESFNSMCQGSKRNLSQLKSQWNMTKITARKDMASYRRESKKTGGGPNPAENVISADDISVWLPNEFIIDNNEFDSDVVVSEIPQVGENRNIVETQILRLDDKVESLNEDREGQDEPKSNLEQQSQQDVSKKRKKNPSCSVADETIKEVAKFDLKCREELHKLQVANEEKKARNLDMEHKVLLKKYEILEAQMDCLKKTTQVPSEWCSNKSSEI